MPPSSSGGALPPSSPDAVVWASGAVLPHKPVNESCLRFSAPVYAKEASSAVKGSSVVPDALLEAFFHWGPQSQEPLLLRKARRRRRRMPSQVMTDRLAPRAMLAVLRGCAALVLRSLERPFPANPPPPPRSIGWTWLGKERAAGAWVGARAPLATGKGLAASQPALLPHSNQGVCCPWCLSLICCLN